MTSRVMTAGLSAPASASPMKIGERIHILDSLRGVAILSVFLYHAFFWSGLRGGSEAARAVALLTRPGWLGVDLFFVLSGFLITGRLLDRRHLAVRQYYRWFYTRRALRILPLYFTTLLVVGAVMWWAGETSWEFLAASVVFMPNIALLAGWWTTGPLAVLWSLGIEEQVYLVWPFLVRVLTVRRLAWLFVAVGLAEPVLRYATFSAGLMREGLSVATWLRLDGFAWGGLLADCSCATPASPVRVWPPSAPARWRPQPASPRSARGRRHFTRRPASETSSQLACADVVLRGARGGHVVACRKRSGAPAAPRRSLLASFGRISYCLYLVHLFAFWSFDRIAQCPRPCRSDRTFVRAVIVLAVSTAIAELSWRYVERPSLESAARDSRPAGRREGHLMRVLITADPYIPVPPLHYGGIERVIDVLVRELDRGATR